MAPNAAKTAFLCRISTSRKPTRRSRSHWNSNGFGVSSRSAYAKTIAIRFPFERSQVIAIPAPHHFLNHWNSVRDQIGNPDDPAWPHALVKLLEKPVPVPRLRVDDAVPPPRQSHRTARHLVPIHECPPCSVATFPAVATATRFRARSSIGAHRSTRWNRGPADIPTPSTCSSLRRIPHPESTSHPGSSSPRSAQLDPTPWRNPWWQSVRFPGWKISRRRCRISRESPAPLISCASSIRRVNFHQSVMMFRAYQTTLRAIVRAAVIVDLDAGNQIVYADHGCPQDWTRAPSARAACKTCARCAQTATPEYRTFRAA